MKFSIDFKKNAKTICIILFFLYLLILGYFLFLSPAYGRRPDITREYNIIPLKTIKNYIKYRGYIPKIFVTNILGNIIAFMPMGFFIPIIFNNKRSFLKLIFFSAAISLTIEILQLRFSVGSFDVDDIILNTLGGAIGFCLFIIAYGIYHKIKRIN